MFPVGDPDYLRTNPQNLKRRAFEIMLKGAPGRCCLLELGCRSSELQARNADRAPDD